MKEMSDDDLQRSFDEGNFSSKKPLNDNEKAYNALFEALRHEPGNGLPYDFAAKVTRNIKAQHRAREWRYNLVAAVIFLGLIALICGIMAAYGNIDTSTLWKYKWILVLLPVIFIAIQYFDQVLVKARVFKNNVNN